MFLPLERWDRPGLLALLLGIVLLSACESRYGPGDRPSNFGGTVVQTGKTLWLEDLRGKWVLVDCFQDLNDYGAGGPGSIKGLLPQFWPAPQDIDRSRCAVVHVLNPDSPNELLAAFARRYGMSDPIVRVEEQAGWDMLEWGSDYLIAPSGVVLMAEANGQYDWSAALKAVASQPLDFSPLRLTLKQSWSNDGEELTLRSTIYRPGSAPAQCKLKVELQFDQYDTGQASYWRINSKGQGRGQASFELGSDQQGDVVLPFVLKHLKGCSAAAVIVAVFDQRLGLWISRSATYVPADDKQTQEMSSGTQSNSRQDSAYRQPTPLPR